MAERSPTFREFTFVPRNVVAMIASGEKSGSLPEVIEHASAAAEEDPDIAINARGETDDRSITPEERKGFASYLVGYVEA